MKQKQLHAIAETRRREASLEPLCKDEPPDPSGRWRPQDHLAHMAWYREFDARLIEAVSTGGEIPPDPGDNHNAAVYAATRDQSRDTVIANAHRSWDLMESAIAACSEADLERPNPYRKHRKLVEGSPGDHVGAHLMWCFLEAGDEDAAEAVQLWARDLSSRMFPDSRSRGVGAYNLACFYARVGRVDEAVTLLREGLEGAPDLREWSHKDPDLDGIRDDPRVAEVLGARV